MVSGEDHALLLCLEAVNHGSVVKVDEVEISRLVQPLQGLQRMHFVLKYRAVVHRHRVDDNNRVVGGVGDHVVVVDVFDFEPSDLLPVLHGVAVAVEDKVWSEGEGVVHQVVVERAVAANLPGPVAGCLHGVAVQGRGGVLASDGQGVRVDKVHQREVRGGDVGGVSWILWAQSPQEDVGVVEVVDEPLHHLSQRPVVGRDPGHGDGGDESLRVPTFLVVVRLHHPAAVENLPGLGEGDLVELPPAVHVLAVPPLLCAEPFLTGAVLDVGAHQPAGQGGLLLPGEGEVVELRRLVREEFLPTNVGSLGVEDMSLPCSQQAADIDYWPEIHFIQSCVSPYFYFLI